MRPYTGLRAERYEKDRAVQPRWAQEHEFVAAHLDGVSRVLDCPVGTGRFLPLYRDRRIKVIGVDVSTDMLAQAGKKGYGALLRGNVFDLRVDGEFDMAVCVRFFNWISMGAAQRALCSLRVHAKKVLFTVRLRRDGHAPNQAETIVHDSTDWYEMIHSLGLRVLVDEVLHKNIYGDYHVMICSEDAENE